MKAIKKLVPKKVKRLIKSVLWRLEDARGDHGVPPAHLRYKVHGHLHIPTFLAGGESNAHCIMTALTKATRDLPENISVLDFGCGPGGTVAALRNHLPAGSKLFGTDLDHAAIRWGQKNIKEVSFTCNPADPPLPFDSNFFDVIYAISVFTHLNERYQFAWLQELHRIARPGALVLLTIHGVSAPAWKHFTSQEKCLFLQSGFFYDVKDGWDLFFPDFYHTTFHSPAYIFEKWSLWYDILTIYELGLGGHQDIVIAKKK